jgi:uncharacterized protein (TIGR03083 family)
VHTDDVWRAIDAERTGLADLLDDLTVDEWAAPSLCAGWRVRDVAAHLTLAHMPPLSAALTALRARGSFDRMIRDSALRQATLPCDEFARRIRAMVGSRRTAPFVTPLEPLIDVLVHGQDIARPLGRHRPMPAGAAAAAADRVWTMGWPFHARRRLDGLRLSATDASWSVGEGPAVEGPLSALLLLMTGRNAAIDQLTGPGVDAVTGRTDAPRRKR